jgi:hypothetical protein
MGASVTAAKMNKADFRKDGFVIVNLDWWVEKTNNNQKL